MIEFGGLNLRVSNSALASICIHPLRPFQSPSIHPNRFHQIHFYETMSKANEERAVGADNDAKQPTSPPALQLNFSPFPVLNTDRLILRETKMTDVEQVFYLRSEPRLQTYVDRDPTASLDEAREFVQTIIDDVSNNVGIQWAIALKGQDDTMIGSIALWRIDRRNYRAELGYVLHPEHQGKGLMQEAIKAVIDYGFQKGLHSLEANINPGNLASQRVLERAGFVKEAHFRENFFYNGRFVDSVIYSLLTPFR